MINLIPFEEKKKLKRDYKIRLFSLALSFLGILLVFATLIFIPSYVVTGIKHSIAQEKLATLQTQTRAETGESMDAIVSDIKTKLSLFKDPATILIPTNDVIDRVLEIKGADIRLTEFSLERAEKKYTLSLGGTAASREALFAFQKKLMGVNRFRDVALPISNFVKGSNIAFEISLAVTQ